ncbi:protein kinase family protein [Streptomyces morookaense]|uniref:Serine/threonine protein kinase n=1 Tax=Streptomyces morookaense TaxID=1970 RepID=A0A7Y7E626_STRMO|nr:protein kinase family protein [Streptomyces morookaense]NVK76772.1 serine/threonine protein kinase [Streptomyces morookaense]GHF26573.1 serine/threonine protein kinase [Streptomyces morookaense]
MAERSTAAVDVADNSGEQPLTAEAGKATTDGAEADKKVGTHQDTAGAESKGSARDAQPLELHSGHKLARRYRLEECVTRLEGFSSWRAVDEKLRRAVGVHILPADHPRARPVLAAARSAALLGDPRFVQVLDAVEENELVYVVHEWLPDATELTPLLAAGPLEPHDAYQLVSQVSQAMAAAHREGLAHLRLTPGSVLRTGTGQYRIRGLAVMAALRGITSEHPQRTDTEAIGALLYAALTQRWPHENNAHGLPGLPKGMGLIAPDQVRAGVHRGLSELAMRALTTASKQEDPCTTPEELAKAVAAMPRIRPPESAFAAAAAYQRSAYRGPVPPHTGGPVQPAPVPPPPPLESRTGKVIKWSVSALLIAALGLGSWQLADTLLKHGESDDPSHSQSTGDGSPKKPESGQPIAIQGAKDFDPLGDGQEKPRDVPKAYDGNPATYWSTDFYTNANFGGLKSGVGLILDLGKKQQVGKVQVGFLNDTSVELRAADSSGDSMPMSLTAFHKVAEGAGTDVPLTPDKPVEARYVLVWLTKLSQTEQGEYRGRVSEIKVTS